jgi:hypothetical protein
VSTYVRFRRRVRLARGFWLNFNRRSISLTAGIPGAHLTWGLYGRRVSLGVPGGGLSVVNYRRYQHHTLSPHPSKTLLIAQH